LQSSKDAFEDSEDIDEFDVAPPPTKNLTISKTHVWKRFRDQIFTGDVSFVIGLVETLANTTVICSVDREGTISLVIST
jgi:hypothetical protein